MIWIIGILGQVLFFDPEKPAKQNSEKETDYD